MKYSEFKDLRGKKINEFPMGFAFNDKQFEEAKEKLGVKDNSELCSIWGGGFIRKADVHAFRALLDEGNKGIELFCKDDEQLKDALKYEFANHECGYTGDYEAVWEILNFDIDKLTDRDKRIFQEAKTEFIEANIDNW